MLVDPPPPPAKGHGDAIAEQRAVPAAASTGAGGVADRRVLGPAAPAASDHGVADGHRAGVRVRLGQDGRDGRRADAPARIGPRVHAARKVGIRCLERVLRRVQASGFRLDRHVDLRGLLLPHVRDAPGVLRSIDASGIRPHRVDGRCARVPGPHAGFGRGVGAIPRSPRPNSAPARRDRRQARQPQNPCPDPETSHAALPRRSHPVHSLHMPSGGVYTRMTRPALRAAVILVYTPPDGMCRRARDGIGEEAQHATSRGLGRGSGAGGPVGGRGVRGHCWGAGTGNRADATAESSVGTRDASAPTVDAMRSDARRIDAAKDAGRIPDVWKQEAAKVDVTVKPEAGRLDAAKDTFEAPDAHLPRCVDAGAMRAGASARRPSRPSCPRRTRTPAR